MGMNSFTPCLGDGLESHCIVTSGKSASNLANSSSAEAMDPRLGPLW